MPVRVIKQITRSHAAGGEMIIPTPKSVLDAYTFNGKQLVCLVKSHFSKDKTLVTRIGETVKLRPPSGCGNEIQLSGEPITQKYGFVMGEYLEIIFEAIEHSYRSGFFERIKTATVPIFPERMVEDLDFVP